MSKAGIRKGKRTAFLILVLLMCAVTVFPAFAQEEWENLQISLLYMDASGQEAQVDAVPVTWSGEQQAFWATVPDGIGAFTLRVQHPQHPDYVFMPGSGTMVSVMAGSDLAPETALVMTASDGNGTEIDHYALYVSLSPTPEETYEVLEREIPIICQTVDGKVLSMESVMISYGQTQIVQRPVIDGYEPVEDAPESLTVSVSQDGIPSQEMIIFVYSPIQPVTREIQVSYYLMDGTLLTLDTVMLQEGEQTLSRRNFEGYQGAEGTPDTITVTLYTDGTFTPENPAFYLQAIQTAPITKEIQVSYALTDGTLLATQAVTLQEGEQVLVRQEISGYAAAEGTPDTMTVTLYADGTVAPENPVFYLQAVQAAPITKDIQVSYVLADGTLLAAQAVTLQEGEQILARQEISGYAAAEGTLDTITVTLYADGTVVPENPSFLLQPVQTAPVQKEITVYWAADNMILAQEIYTIEAGTSITVERRTFDGYEPDSDTPEVITVSLNTDGTLTPSSPVFLYHAVYVPASREIQVTYVADGSTVLHSQIYTVTEGEPQTFQLLAFEGYVPDDGMPETVTVTVSADGTASAESVTFSYHTYVAPTDVPPVTIPIHYMDLGGNALAPDQSITMEAGRSAVLAPDASLLPSGYDPDSAGTVTIQVSVDGIPSPAEVEFVFRHYEAQETAIPAGSYINRWAQTTAKGVNVRTEPAKKGNAGTVSKTGTKVYAIQSVVNDKGETWIKVNYNGTEGYIANDFLQILTQAQSDDYQDTLTTAAPYVTPEGELPTEIPSTEVPATEEPVTLLPETEEPVTLPPTATPAPEQYAGYALTQQVVALRDEVSIQDSSIMTTLPVSTLVVVNGQVYTDEGVAWSQVQTLSSVIGFVPDSVLRRINDQEADYYIRQYWQEHPTATPVSAATEAPVQITGYAYTIGDNIPFRNMYSDKSVILSQLSQNTAVYVAGQVYETEDGWPWHIVLYNGTWGYIRSDMLRMMNAAETSQYLSGSATAAPTSQVTAKPYDPDSPSSYGYIYASNNGAVNMRKTASTKAEVIKRLRNYAFCLVLGSETIDGTTWYRVQYDGSVGYVSGNFFRQMTLAELEEFLSSEEYTQGIINNTTSSSAGQSTVTAAPVISQEEQNVTNWTDPSSGLNVTYATWAPFATTAPLATATATAEVLQTATPAPTLQLLTSPSQSPDTTAEPIPTVEIETAEDRKGSSLWVWIVLLVILGGGTAYILVIRKKNQARAAQRARERKAQMARQQAAAAAERPKTGTYSQGQPASAVRKPFVEGTAGAQRAGGEANGNAARTGQTVPQSSYRSVFSANQSAAQAPEGRASGKSQEQQAAEVSPYARPAASTQDVKSQGEEQHTAGTAPTEGAQRSGRRTARRRAAEQAAGEKPENQV